MDARLSFSAGRYADDLTLALALADEADALTMLKFGAVDLVVETKPDMTPVTEADEGAESVLRSQLALNRPDDGILGEEFGGAAPATGRHWVIDPIDGTKNFVRGVPVWATLIALLDDGVPVVGVVSAPALQRRWWASAGGGAFTTDGSRPARSLAVSAVAELSAASLSFSDLTGWADRDRFIALTDEVWRIRGYGDFHSYCLLAEGAVDIATEPEVKIWDLAALDVLVREAGGTFTDLQGKPGPSGGSALATNGLLHEQVLSRL